MKKKFRNWEIALFALGAILFGLAVYFIYYPRIAAKLVEAKNREWQEDKPKLKKLVRVQLGADDNTSTIGNVKDILYRRIDRMGYKIEAVQINEADKSIQYTLNDITDTSALYMIMAYKGEFSCQQTYEASELMNAVAELNQALKTRPMPKKPKSDTQNLFGDVRVDGSVVNTDTMAAEEKEWEPLFEVFTPNLNGGEVLMGASLGFVKSKDIEQAMSYFTSNEAKQLFPADVKLCLSITPFNRDIYTLYAIKETIGGPILTTDMVASAKQEFNTLGLPETMLELMPLGRSKFDRATADAASTNPKKCLALLIDDKVVSAPMVQTRISIGKVSLAASTEEEAKALATVVKSDKLPVPIRITIQN